MSEWGIVEWETNDSRRAARRRVRATTLRFVERYETLLDDLERQGLTHYVSRRVREARETIWQIRSLLDIDPFAARDLSMSLGEWIHRLPATARRLRREERAQRRRERSTRSAPPKRSDAPRTRRASDQPSQQEAIETVSESPVSGALLEVWQEEVERIADDVERDFAWEELQELRRACAERAVLPSQLQAEADAVRQQVAAIRQRAQEAAERWRAEHEGEIEHEATTAFVETCQEVLAADREAAEEALQQLSSLRAALTNAPTRRDDAQVRDTAAQVVRTATRGPAHEQDRRQVAAALVESLQRVGFVVQPPRRIQEKDRDVVVIRARKPAGQQAVLEIGTDGTLVYKFDQYEGQTCQKDIQQINQLLESTYGVKLSNKRVTWQNPDRILKGQRRPPTDTEQSRHGR